MLYDEYPHVVTFQMYAKVPDGAGGYVQDWVDTLTIDAFMDTPSSREIFAAMQLQNPLDRNLYYAYRTDVNEKMQCIYEGETYELTGKPQNQGGQHEVMKVPLKLVQHGGK